MLWSRPHWGFSGLLLGRQRWTFDVSVFTCCMMVKQIGAHYSSVFVPAQTTELPLFGILKIEVRRSRDYTKVDSISVLDPARSSWSLLRERFRPWIPTIFSQPPVWTQQPISSRNMHAHVCNIHPALAHTHSHLTQSFSISAC